MKIIAYRMDWDVCWEPGMPDPKSPDYSQAEKNSYRYHCREVGLQYDANIIDSEFLDSEEFTYDLWTAPKPEIERQNVMSTKFNIDKSICFDASLELLTYLDFPYSNPTWPIMSQQMLGTLERVGAFRYHTYPTIMEDNTVHRAYSGVDMDRTGLKMHNFLIVQTLEFLDPYDWVNSDYIIEKEIDWEGKERITARFTKLVLKEPLPPFFRLNGYETALYVSAAAKEALQASNTARGAIFFPVDEEYEIKLSHYPIPEEYLKNIIDV
jgi:hypothetical protein